MESKFKSPTKARQEEPESEKLFSQAVAFFKTFGCKANGCLRSSSLPSPDAPIGYPCANIYGPDRRFELGDTSGDMSRPVQLDSNKVHNMDNKAQWITPGASISLHCKEYTETTTNLHPRESDPRSNTPQSINSNGSITAVSVQCGNSSSLNDVIGSKNTTVISHVSLIQGSYVLPRNDNRTPPLDKSQVNTSILRPFIPTYARSSFDGHQIPVRRTHDTSVPASIAYIAADSSHNEGHNEGKSNSHAHITNLRAVVRAMSEEWIRRLALSTNTPQLYAEQYACALFELGVRALRNYFRGAIPSSFHDVFALLHVAVASSYIIHKNDHTHSWNAYLEEACQWQHLLSDVMERGTFVKVIRRLCHPQGSTASSSSKDLAIDDVLLPAEHATLVRLFGHLSSACVDVTIQEEGDRSRQQPTTDNGQIRLPGTLQSTVIVQECTDFLDSRFFCHVVLVLTNLMSLGRFRSRGHC